MKAIKKIEKQAKVIKKNKKLIRLVDRLADYHFEVQLYMKDGAKKEKLILALEDSIEPLGNFLCKQGYDIKELEDCTKNLK